MNTVGYPGMSSLDMDNLLNTFDTSLKIRKRFQFFLWAQGGLQSQIPHDTLICAWGDVAASRFRFEVFSRNAVDEKVLRELTNPFDGHLTRLATDWHRRGGQPLLLPLDQGEPQSSEVRAALQRLGYGHALAHGAPEMGHDQGSFFLFLNLPVAPDHHVAYTAELLMPYLHMALYRMARQEPDNGRNEASTESILSTREMEVLAWVREGKTNQEIAQILSISPLTVKNHVQNILRKLNVTNRAQAVAKGITSNLLATDSAH